MALVQGIHILAKGSKTKALEIAPDIQKTQRLFVGSSTWFGAGAYAWHPDCFLESLRHKPQVLFEIDDGAIIDLFHRDGTPWGFFLIPGDIGSYVTIDVVEFINVW